MRWSDEPSAVAIAPSDGVRVVACPHPFSSDRIERVCPPGSSLAELLRSVEVDPALVHARVYLDDRLIPEAYWERLRPPAGHLIVVRVVPTGSETGKNILRIVALIGVAIAAAFVPPVLGFAAGTIGFAAVAGAIGVLGALAVNALIPPPGRQLADLSGTRVEESPALSITGTRNSINLYGPVPQVLGKHLLYPPMAALPFTEVQGNDQYLRLLFCCGYGPLLMSQFKIGETPLEQFTGVEMEVRFGYPNDPPLTLFIDSAHEESLSILLTQAAGFQSRVSHPKATELSVDVTFPNGLVRFDTAGNPQHHLVEIQVEYRAAGTTEWIGVNSSPPTRAQGTTALGGNRDLSFVAVNPGFNGNNILIGIDTGLDPGFPRTAVVFSNGFVTAIGVPVADVDSALDVMARVMAAASHLVTVTLAPGSDGTGLFQGIESFQLQLQGGTDSIESLEIMDNRVGQVRRSLRWHVAEGTYDVRVARITADSTDNLIRDQVYWTTLRTISHTIPITKPGFAMVAMRIKATDQLNGTIDQFNLVAESIVPDWDGAQGRWIARATSRPASLYRHVLLGPANPRPVTLARLDEPSLTEWHAANVVAKQEFNAVIDYQTTTFELLQKIAAAGRATFAMPNGRYGVVRDVPDQIPVQVFSPRNSWGFRGHKIYVDYPHALKIRFIDRNQNWKQTERVVYDDGYSEANATRFEDMEFIGVTDPEQVWRDGRYFLAVGKLRPETYELSADAEGLVCTRGSLVQVVHDVPLWGVGAARVAHTTLDGLNRAVSVTIDDPVTLLADRAYTVRYRRNDGQQIVQEIQTVAGEQATLTFTVPIAESLVPQVGDLLTVGETIQESVPLLVKAIEFGPDLSAKLTLVDYAPGVHLAELGPIPPHDPHITDPGGIGFTVPDPIIDWVRSDESVLFRDADGSLQSRIVISLHFTSGYRIFPRHINVQYRPSLSNGAWHQISVPVSGFATDVPVSPVQDGETYDLMVRAVSHDDEASRWVTILGHTVTGKSSRPPDVTQILWEGNGTLHWSYPEAPLDLAGFLLRRHHGERTTWEDAQPLHAGLITETTFTDLRDSGLVTYLLKAVDTSGNESAHPGIVVANLGDMIVENVLVTTDKKAAGFPGTITNGTIIGGNLVAVSMATMWSADPTRLMWRSPSDLFWTQRYAPMAYTTSFVPDADKVPCALLLDLTVNAPAWTLEYRVSGAELFYSGTPSTLMWSGVASTPMWSQVSQDWLPWPGRIAHATQQVYEFRVTTQSGPVQGSITKYQIVLDVPDVLERMDNVAISAGGTRLTLTRTYRAISNVSLTVQEDGGSAITAKAIDKNPTTGPLVKCFDAAGVAVAGTVDATVQGY